MAGSCRLTDDLQLDRQMRHNIEVVIDRLVAGELAPAAGRSGRAGAEAGGGEPDRRATRDARRGSRRRKQPTANADEAQEVGAGRRAGRRGRAPSAAASRRPSPFGPLRLHALRPELRAAQPAAVQLQQPAGHVPGVRRPGRALHASIPSCLIPDAELLVQAGLLRADRPVARPGPLAAAHLSRRGRHARTQARARPRARCSKRPGTSSIRRLQNALAVGHRRRAHHVHLAQRRRRATSTAASSRASSPSCSPSTATRKSRMQLRQLEKYMRVMRLRRLRRRSGSIRRPAR